jgi:hypothetical protein
VLKAAEDAPLGVLMMAEICQERYRQFEYAAPAVGHCGKQGGTWINILR